MNFKFLIPALFVVPVVADASTKRLDCTQTTDKGVLQVMRATIDDNSDKAEVQMFATSAKCAANESCGTDVYKKEVLPSVIRLSAVLSPGSLSYTTIIDIDRTNLVVVTHTSLSGSGISSETTANGQCTVKVDNVKKAL